MSLSPAFDQPFPLRRYFRRRVIPFLIFFTIGLMTLSAYSGRIVIESIYLEISQQRAGAIERAVSKIAPEAWRALLAGESSRDVNGQAAYQHLIEAFDDEVVELNLISLKVYDPTGLTIYATDYSLIGIIEKGAALKHTLDTGKAGLDLKTGDNGLDLYELYIPINDQFGRLKAVFELYEPVNFLNSIIMRDILPGIIALGVMLLVLVIGLGYLVGRAQRDIDQRTESLRDLSRKLEAFVSTSTLDAARDASNITNGEIQSKRRRYTLLFSDVRDFTGFAESNPSERVVKFLNELMNTQVRIIRNHGGDIDKMIGDAVLAHFNGDNAEARAIAAAKEILIELKEGFLPRGIGIGIYSGDVISGAVGPTERRDFTVIGDAVNIAARLCANAARDMLIVDRDTLALAPEHGASFTAPETISVKGRTDGIVIQHWSA